MDFVSGSGLFTIYINDLLHQKKYPSLVQNHVQVIGMAKWHDRADGKAAIIHPFLIVILINPVSKIRWTSCIYNC